MKRYMNSSPREDNAAVLAPSGNWRLFERSKSPRGFRLQPRDVQIVREVFRHRFLRPVHIQLLLGGSPANLARRCKLLWEHRFLERPVAQRPLRLLVEQLIYGLGPEGVALLKRHDPRLRDERLDWVETPRRQRGWPFIEHALSTSDFFVCLEVAARERGIELLWNGHFNLKRHRVRVGRTVVQPDGYFVLRDPSTNRAAHHFLEIDRGNVSLNRMRERYLAYFGFWKNGAERRPFEHFRVLTIAPNESHMQSLRAVASQIGRDSKHAQPWWGLWFAHAGAFGVEAPIGITSSIFWSAGDGPARSLLDAGSAAA